ncbi:hypothetical protein TNCV_3978461 [Trichonephila clavipes]|nr:hypothetical protein TNCV_3978461 [Trichonephila clavipes]
MEHPTTRQHGIMIWGTITYGNRYVYRQVVRIQGNMTTQPMLKPHVLFLRRAPNPDFSKIKPCITLHASANILRKLYTCLSDHHFFHLDTSGTNWSPLACWATTCEAKPLHVMHVGLP